MSLFPRIAVPLSERLGNAVYGRDPELREHVKRLLRIVALAAFASLLLWIATLQGLTPAWTTAVEVAYLAAGFGALYAVQRTGLARRWGDPSLAHVRLLFSVTAVVLAYGLIEIARGSVLQLLCLLLAFEMDRLSPRQLLRASLLAVLLIALTLAARMVLQPEAVRLDVDVYNLGMAALLLPTAIVVGAEIGRLYRRHVRQREALAHTLAQLNELSTRDPLTGLLNRRQMTVLLEQEHRRWGRTGRAFSIGLLDIDWFKRINDTHGHAAGDEVLRRFARAAAQAVGPADALARWGGEEFLVIMPGRDEAEAAQVLVAVRAAVCRVAWHDVAPGLEVTVSAGVAEQGADRALAQTLAQADRALYRAKRGGRNRVVAAGEPLRVEELARADGTDGGEAGPWAGDALDAPSAASGAAEGDASCGAAPQAAAPSSGAVRLERRGLLAGREDEDEDDEDLEAAQARLSRPWALIGRVVRDAAMGSDPAMREHLRLPMIGMGIYGIWLAMMHFWAMPAGQFDPLLGHILIAYDLMAILVFYFLIRSGMTAHWKDPALVLPQMVVACGGCVIAYVGAPNLRASVLHLMCVIQVFGMVTLTPRQSRSAGVCAVLLLLGLTAGMVMTQATGFDPRLDTLRLALAAFIVGRLAMLSWDYGQVREKVSQEKRQLAEAVAQVQELVIRDALTGLFNRKYMHDLLERELRRCMATGHPFCVALVDLDHFKQVNDSHGHAVGDEVLTGFAQLALATLRDTDVIGRWGGEEFVVVLRDTEPARHGMHALARLRERLRQHRVARAAPLLRVTFSSGLALARSDEALASLLERADQALYAAKAGGRDRCMMAQDQMSPPASPRPVASALT